MLKRKKERKKGAQRNREKEMTATLLHLFSVYLQSLGCHGTMSDTKCTLEREHTEKEKRKNTPSSLFWRETGTEIMLSHCGWGQKQA